MRAKLLLLAVVGLPGPALAEASTGNTPIQIPLKHVISDGEGDAPDMLGIMIGLNDGPPRLLQFDTGSDALNIQADKPILGVEPVPGAAPKKYGYGDGSYGYWQQKIRFDRITFHDPEKPGQPVATFGGGHVANQVLEMVYTKDYHAFDQMQVTSQPIGYDDNGDALYADLEYRRRMHSGDPGEDGAFYGTFGASDSIGREIDTSPLGGRTRSGYVVAANANLDGSQTPGCAPCLVVHLTPAIRSQFTALVPWGHLDYRDGDYQLRFPQSGANASNQYEGTYTYRISFKAGHGKRMAEFQGPILFDTGTVNFLYPSAANVLEKLRKRGFNLKENEDDEVDFSIHGSEHGYDQLDYGDVDISRLDDEDDGDGITIGMPFFQANAVLYDLENRITGYSPFFLSAENFSTDASSSTMPRLHHVTGQMGSQGWLGLAGDIHGSGDLRIGEDAVVRMTGTNTYTGTTVVDGGGVLYLAGPGTLEHSARVDVDGVLNVEQVGGQERSWGVAGGAEVVLRSLGGMGSLYIGNRMLVLTAADARFSGAISDVDDAGNSMAGRLLVRGGKLELAGENSYTGKTEVARGAELRVSGSLAGDVSVAGVLIVDGEVTGQVRVENGGVLRGSGTIDDVIVAPGGRSERTQPSSRH